MVKKKFNKITRSIMNSKLNNHIKKNAIKFNVFGLKIKYGG